MSSPTRFVTIIIEVLGDGGFRCYCGSCAIELADQPKTLSALRLFQCQVCGAFNEAPKTF